MSSAVSRVFLRQQQLALRRGIRNASSATEAAQSGAAKAKDTASQATSKASEGLTRVQSSAGNVASRAGAMVTNTVGRIGGRTGRLIGFVQSMIPPTIYYSRVGLELSKLVFQGQKMQPPSMAQFQTYTQPLVNFLRNPLTYFSQASNTASNMQPMSLLGYLRHANSQQLAFIGITFAEVVGFFSVGEMIGRLKIIGYHSGKGLNEAHNVGDATVSH